MKFLCCVLTWHKIFHFSRLHSRWNSKSFVSAELAVSGELLVVLNKFSFSPFQGLFAEPAAQIQKARQQKLPEHLPAQRHATSVQHSVSYCRIPKAPFHFYAQTDRLYLSFSSAEPRSLKMTSRKLSPSGDSQSKRSNSSRKYLLTIFLNKIRRNKK